MSFEEIQNDLSEAWHEIGHAYSDFGGSRYLAALQAVAKARKKINAAYKALEKIQD